VRFHQHYWHSCCRDPVWIIGEASGANWQHRYSVLARSFIEVSKSRDTVPQSSRLTSFQRLIFPSPVTISSLLVRYQVPVIIASVLHASLSAAVCYIVANRYSSQIIPMVKVKVGIWLFRRLSLAIWDHTVLPATQHRWTCPTLTPAG